MKTIDEITAELAELNVRAAADRAEIIRLETEIRRKLTLSTGDYVKITDATECVGQYGRIIRVGSPHDLLPYHIDVLPYHTKVHAYSVEPVDKSAVAEFLTEVAAQLT